MQKNSQKKNKGINRRTFLKVAGVAGAATLVGGFPYVVHPSVKEVLIGNITPLTGPLAGNGNQVRGGVDLAAEEINAAGGIKSLGGAKLKILHADSEGKVELGVAEAERLIQKEGVPVFLCYGSSIGYAVAATAEKYKTPLLLTMALADNILERGFKYTFRIICNTSQAVKRIMVIFVELAREMGSPVKTFATIHEDTLFGTPNSDLARKFAPELGLEMIADIPYSFKTADLSTEVGKLKAAKPDIICPTGYTGDMALFARTLKEMKVNCKAVVGLTAGGMSWDYFAKEVGDAAEYLMNGTNGTNPIHPRNLANAKKWRWSGQYAMDDAGYPYMTVFTLKDALERAGSLDKKAIRDALAATKLYDHTLVTDKPIVFDETGQNINAFPPVSQIQKGKVVWVWPKQYSTGKPIFPVPRWEDRK